MTAQATFTGAGLQTLGAHARLGAHLHAAGYVTVVLAGGYHEAGDGGRGRLEAGDVALHGAFARHLNEVCAGGARVLNLACAEFRTGFGRIPDPDHLATVFERDPVEAADLFRTLWTPRPAPVEDWPDLLAGALRDAPRLSIVEWAAQQGVRPETVSRGFRLAFGVSPKRYRYERQIGRALELIRTGGEPLAEIALRAGFSDQAHMTRAVRELTGATPGSWRKTSTACKTRPDARADMDR